MPSKRENCENIEDDQPVDSSNPSVTANGSTSTTVNTPGNEHLKQQVCNSINDIYQGISDKLDPISNFMFKSNLDFVRSSNCSVSWSDDLHTADITDASADQRGSPFVEKYKELMARLDAFRESQTDVVFDGSLASHEQIAINFLTSCKDEARSEIYKQNIQILIDHLRDPDCQLYKAKGAEEAEVDTSDAPSLPGENLSSNDPPGVAVDVAPTSESANYSAVTPGNAMIRLILTRKLSELEIEEKSCKENSDDTEKKLEGNNPE